MYMSAEIRRGIFRLTSDEMDGDLTGILGSLRRLFVMLNRAKEQSVSPVMLTDAFGWKDGQTRVQQDAHEMLNLLMEQIDLQTAGSSVAGLIPRLYRGSLRYRTQCMSCGAASDRMAEEWGLMSNVQGYQSLDQSIASLFSEEGEILDESNKYECGSCKEMVCGRITVAPKELPPMLWVNLKRFSYALVGNEYQRIKIKDRFEFGEELNLSPFMIDGEEANYKLTAVVIHTGSAGGGHYHALIKDELGEGHWEPERLKNKQDAEGAEAEDGAEAEAAVGSDAGGWYDFDDTTVTAVPSSKLLGQYEGTSSAYMLLYRRVAGAKSETLAEAEEVALPEEELQLVHTRNEELAVDRAKYEVESRVLSFTVYPSSSFQVCRGVLEVAGEGARGSAAETETGGDEGAGVFGGMFGEEDEAQAHEDTGPLQGAVQVQIDDRATWSELLARIRELCPSTPEPAVLHTLVTSNQVPWASVQLSADPETALHEVDNLVSGASVLCWDGITVQGQEYRAADAKPLRITVVALSSGEDGALEAVETTVVAASSESLHSVVAVAFCHQSADQKVVYSSPPKDPLVLEESLAGCALADGALVTVELAGREEPLAHRRHLLEEHMVEVSVVDQRACAVAEGASRTLVPRGLSTLELKSYLAQQLGWQEEADVYRLRTASKTELGVDGEELVSERAVLWDERELPHQYLIVETGRPAAADEICLQWGWTEAGARAGYVLVKPKQTTLAKVKALIAAQEGIDSQLPELRLRESEGARFPTELFKDEIKTVAKCGLLDNDFVMIESGSPPARGGITIAVSLLRDDAETPTQLGNASTNIGCTLHELKQTLMEQFGEMMGGVDDPARLRVLKLHRRKCTDIHKPDSATMKQLGIQEGNEIVVKLLDAPEQLSATAIVLNVVLRNNEARAIEGEHELVFELQGPGASALTSAVAQEFGVDPSVAVLAKHLAHKHSWQRLPPNDECLACLLYTSPSPRDRTRSRMPSSA
eukprot:TRINITY_DN6010_c0_g2_i4.p1 TRINITY_DN6010_c0_g2~~TRINITY_DN6010_c0_g2_i4.p1  ORF type:complete len:990 (+),score=251.41 TRINITY_DN6010_c0_g2_i4:3-2972(+)